MAIISRRGRKVVPPTAPKNTDLEVQLVHDVEVFIFQSSNTGFPLTEEELNEIREVFDNIRKQLDGIVGSP